MIFSFQDYFERSFTTGLEDLKLLLLVKTLRVGSSFVTARPGRPPPVLPPALFSGPLAACRSLRSSTPGAARRRACCRGCHSPPPCRSASPRSSQHLPFRWRDFSLVSKSQKIITWNTFCFFQYCGSGMFIPDPRFKFSIPDPGPKRFRFPDPYPHQRI